MSDRVQDAEPVRLLRVPHRFHSVTEVLGAALRMDLPNVLVLSELANGDLLVLDDGQTLAQCNWLLDRIKALMLAPHQPMRPDDGPSDAA